MDPYVNAPPNMYGQGPPRPHGYGQPGMMPPAGQPNMFNGPSQSPQRPDGPGGPYGPGPMKSVAQGPPLQNGPGHGPQGDQMSPNSFGMVPMRPPRPPGSGQQLPMRGPGPVAPNQLSNQMGSMNISGQPPGPGIAPPTSMQPPVSMGGGPPRPLGPHGGPPGPGMGGQHPPMSQPGSMPPPSMMARPQGPAGGPPGPMGIPPTSMPGPPSSMSGPPSSMLGPLSSMSGPPTSMPGPPSSMHGPPSGPPTSYQGPGMAGPPTSMHPPPVSSAMGGVPVSGPPQMGSQMPPPGLYGNQGPPIGGAPPPTMDGQFPSQGPQVTPPPTPGGQYSGYGAQQSTFGGPRPTGPGGMPGAPGMPGAGPPGMPGGGGMPGAGPAGMPGQAPQQPRRLDPDQMPSPIQVIEDDKTNRGGLLQTANRGLVPPLVTTNFICEDQGNVNPRFMRSTVYNIPCTSEMSKQSHIPIALSISPFAKLHDRENPPPLVDFGQLGPIRCKRCKAYICPYMQFIDGGRRFQCNFCTAATDVPPEYFAHLDHTGRRVDTYDRPELCLGSYEFVATTDYCRNNKLPKPPAFIFMIDVSYNSVKSGLVHLLCSRLKEDILVNLPKEAGTEESEIRVGFVTYHRELHFYNVKGNLAQPQMLVVSDVQDVFVPLLDGFLVRLSESEAVIDSLLAQIPQMFGESRETEIVLGPVIQAGLDALKSADCAGKLIIFHSSLPTMEAPGKLKNRDDRKLLGTDKEKTILTPQGNFYTKLGQDCVASGCGVDLFLFSNSFIDIATIAEVPRLTGGSIYKYMYFQADLEGNRFMEDLKQHLEKPIAFDAIMRIRTSTGIRPTDFLGNFYMSNTTDIELATVDCDKSIGIEIKHDDKLTESEGAYIQAAVLYTSISGQRRLRVHNLGLNCCTQMADLFRSCELDTLVNWLSKYAIRETLQKNPKEVRENLMNQCAQILACYRKNCASPSSAGQLILPECMKLLPLYSNCIIKSNAFQGASEISTDDKSHLMFLVNGMTVKASHAFFYPRLIPLHDLDNESTSLPSALRCSNERLKENGVYLLENGQQMFLWIGHNVDPKWVSDVFGVQSTAQIDIDKNTILDLDNPTSQRVRAAIKRVRDQRNRHMKLFIIRQRDKLEPLFHQFLVEDRGANGTASYVDFLCHIHKEIRNLLS